MKKIFLLLMILGFSVSCFAIKPVFQNINDETLKFDIIKDTIGLELDQVLEQNQQTFDPNKDRFRIASGFVVVCGILTLLGLLLAFLGGLSLTTATVVGIYLIVAAIPAGFISMLIAWLYRRKIELTKKERKRWTAALIFTAISVLIILGVGLIP